MRINAFCLLLVAIALLGFQSVGHSQAIVSPAVSYPEVVTPSTPPRQIKRPVTPPSQPGVPSGMIPGGGVLSAAISSVSAQRNGGGRNLEDSELNNLTDELFVALCLVDYDLSPLCELLAMEFRSVE